MAIGGALYQGNSGLVAGPLGVVKVGFNGYDMGKTVSEAMLDVVQNVKDINYQQDGTVAADKVRTGMIFQLKVTFGEINTGLLAAIMAGFDATSVNPLADAAVLNRSLYSSMRTNEVAPLKIAKVDANGSVSDLDEDVLSFYEAICNVDGTLINWGADTQRGVAVTFDIYWHEFDVVDQTTYKGAFGYYGDPLTSDVPALVWPDRFGPQIISAGTTAATSIDVIFDEKTALIGGVTLVDRFALVVDGDYVIPTVATIGTDPDEDTITLTVPSITTGQVITLDFLPNSIEDLETVPNPNGKQTDISVTNNV
jgi:hypothetical protein